MYFKKSVFIVFFLVYLLTPQVVLAKEQNVSLNEVEYEKVYLKISRLLNDERLHLMDLSSPMRGKVYLDVLWDQLNGTQKNLDLLKSVNKKRWAMADQYRLHLIHQSWGSASPTDSKQVERFNNTLLSGKASTRFLNLYLRHPLDGVAPLDEKVLRRLYPEQMQLYLDTKASFRDKSDEELKDLFYHSKAPEGRYLQVPKLFMFCRHNRSYHCRFLMKDKYGELVRDDRGEIWSQPSLGLARYGVPYDQRNGYTPSGVYTLDSVMPKPDQQWSYGKFRRVIMNFIPASGSEYLLKKFLAPSAHDKNWWKESVAARDVGRNLLRIHGTGKINEQPSSLHYPFIKTAGCIMSREGDYPEARYQDQRLLLDQLMKGNGLNPIYQNETRISGVLYLIEIDNKDQHVGLSELNDILELN